MIGGDKGTRGGLVGPVAGSAPSEVGVCSNEPATRLRHRRRPKAPSGEPQAEPQPKIANITKRKGANDDA